MLAFALAAIFLASQLHCCVDLYTGPADSHACPVCVTVGAALATGTMTLALAPALHRLEIPCSMPSPRQVSFRYTTPRAPPSIA